MPSTRPGSWAVRPCRDRRVEARTGAGATSAGSADPRGTGTALSVVRTGGWETWLMATTPAYLRADGAGPACVSRSARPMGGRAGAGPVMPDRPPSVERPCRILRRTCDAQGVKTSAGILLHRAGAAGREVLLGHMGGPFWAKKDAGGWSIPKGEYEPGEDAFAVACREFEEELGTPVPADGLPAARRAPHDQQQGAHRLGGRGRPRRRGHASATPSSWSGRRARGASRSSPRSTGPPGSRSTRPARSW